MRFYCKTHSNRFSANLFPLVFLLPTQFHQRTKRKVRIMRRRLMRFINLWSTRCSTPRQKNFHFLQRFANMFIKTSRKTFVQFTLLGDPDKIKAISSSLGIITEFHFSIADGTQYVHYSLCNFHENPSIKHFSGCNNA